MRHPRNIVLRLSSESNIVKAFSHESCEMNGVLYHAFHWTPYFNDDQEPSSIPIWISLPGLPPNFYQESFLHILTTPIGRFIRCDNPTCCATQTDGARLCLEIDVAKEPLPYFWIRALGLASSRKQEIMYEMLPVYCCKCKMQGHNTKNLSSGKSGEW